MSLVNKSRWWQIIANATLTYPLLVTGLFYGEWFLAWFVLGHRPIAWDDDPKFIVGSSWMHGITLVAIIGILPVGAAAVFSNVMYIIRVRSTAVQAGIRLQTLVAVWLAMYVLVFTDPYYPIVEWWLD